MSFIAAFEAEFTRVRDELKAKVEELTGRAEAVLTQEIAVLKADKMTIIGDVKNALDKAKADAVAVVQANEPAAAAAVSQALTTVEQAILDALGSHLVG